MIALNLGCGPCRYDGELGVDLYPTGGADVQGDLLALPFRDQVADRVRLDHVLEHQPQRMGVAVLREAHRVLKPGGTIVVGVPDLADYCRHYLAADAAANAQEKALLLRGIYGGQSHPGEHHAAGYDRQLLVDLLEAVGFEAVTVDVDEGPARLEGYCISATGVRA